MVFFINRIYANALLDAQRVQILRVRRILRANDMHPPPIVGKLFQNARQHIALKFASGVHI